MSSGAPESRHLGPSPLPRGSPSQSEPTVRDFPALGLRWCRALLAVPRSLPTVFLTPQDKEYVGFAALPNQLHRKSVKKGFDFTLMVAGLWALERFRVYSGGPGHLPS